MRKRLYTRKQRRVSGVAVLTTLPATELIQDAARRITARRLLIGAVAALAVALMVSLVSFMWPRTLAFSYTENNCITHPLLLPGLISRNQSATYVAEPQVTLSIAGYPLYSHTICIMPVHMPAEHTKEAIGLGTSFMRKHIRVSSGTFPTPVNDDIAATVISTQDPLTLELDAKDRVFGYRLLANNNSADCTKQHRSLECDVATLRLAQDRTYTVTLKRTFNGTPMQAVFERPLAAVEGLQVAATSITPGQTVYDAPEELTLTFTRAVAAVNGAYLQLTDDNRQAVPVTAETNGRTVTVQFEEPLKRDASFLFTVESIRTADGDSLSPSFSLPFKTSNGPQVRSTNIGNTKMPTNGSVMLSFDSSISESQNLAEFIQLEADGDIIEADLQANGNTLNIRPDDELPSCTPLTIRILEGLENEFGIAADTTWQHHTRTLCHNTTKIGESKQGRPITAYRFGDGANVVVFVGGMHGDERSSVHILKHWIEQLEANPERIPDHRTIVVIPNTNPDGFAADTRNNANNVDLNRNFPADDWKPDVTTSDDDHLPTGGGTEPLSEPESQILADYVLGLKPDLVLTYHSIAGYVIPNDAGDSDELARTYAQASDLLYASHDQTDELFPYDTTGAFEDWLHDKHDIPALLIELWTQADNEFPANQDAMWRMVELP